MDFNTISLSVEFLLLTFVILSIFSNLLLDDFSLRLSSRTGALQSWIFNQLGQSSFGDFLIAFCLQFFSFRKKAFFVQLLSFINVGSFTRIQILFLFLGSFVGIGFSSLIMLFPGVLGLILCLLGSFISFLLWRKKAFYHVGLALATLGFFLFFFIVFDQSIQSFFSFDLQKTPLEFFLFFCLLAGTTLFFKTPVGFLIILSVLYSFFNLNIIWFPLLFFLHWMFSLFGFYKTLIQGHRRLYFAVWAMGAFQILQLIFCQILFYFMGDFLELFFQSQGFLSGFKICVVTYFIYFSMTSLFILLLVWMSVGQSWLKQEEYEKQVSQKIMYHRQDNGVFLPHLSFFLLKQEFKKYVTIVHTLLKLSLEIDVETKETNKRLDRYYEVSSRVACEIKQLCSGVGCQSTCDRQTGTVMKYYHQVGLMDQLTKNLYRITSILKEGKGDLEGERECRFWLGLQFKLFENFLNIVIGVEKKDEDKIQSVIEKSYGTLEHFFSGKSNFMENSPRIFYQVTESIEGLYEVDHC